MKKLATFIIVLLGCHFGFSQNYQCIYPDKKAYFQEAESSRVRCVRIDSSFNSGTVMYPFSEIHRVDFDCYRIDQGSWIGKKVVVDHDGNTIFYNGANNPVFINSTAPVNTPWTVYKDEELIIVGEVIDHRMEDFLSLSDSVKVISFKVFNSDSVQITHGIENMTLKISKDYGLVQTINFLNFPKPFYEASPWESMFGELETQNLSLIGLSNPEVGFKNVTRNEEIYDFQVGDVLHLYEKNSSGITDTAREKRTILEYIDREEYEDKIVYKIKQTVNFIDKVNTITQTIKKQQIFFHESCEPVKEDYAGAHVSLNVVWNSKFIGISTSYPPELVPSFNYPEDSGCYTEMIIDGPISGGHYEQGLGGPYFWYENLLWSMYSIRSLVYYKKGDIEWGTPFKLPVGIEERQAVEQVLTIHPNPAKNVINIDNLEFDNIQIYDITGKVEISLNYYEPTIDISGLKSGVYFVVAKSGNTIFKNKMIKL